MFKGLKSLSLALLVISIVTISTGVAFGESLTAEQKTQRRKEVNDTLSGTEWTVQMSSTDGLKKGDYTDTLTFERGRLVSKANEKDGYQSSNITITIEDDGKAVWETMQSHTEKGPIFWRGELNDKTVSGVMSKQGQDGSSTAFSFSGSQSGTFEVQAEKAPVLIEAPPQPSEEEIAAAEKKAEEERAAAQAAAEAAAAAIEAKANAEAEERAAAQQAVVEATTAEAAKTAKTVQAEAVETVQAAAVTTETVQAVSEEAPKTAKSKKKWY